ncbi:ROK family transcriptional regulator [Cellulomonas endophytica]|uniref:ROK family transcriptional regulator n=1 Tax=Cellulomonas endophytica TaxID=2494735 RepID=UPI0010113A40|nr:ROK family transcriptional regulator [Cellulomonas endophytica]
MSHPGPLAVPGVLPAALPAALPAVAPSAVRPAPAGPPAPPRAATGALVLDLLRTHGTVSRVELAARSGLTPATITHAVRELVAEGLVREVGRVRAAVGSPRRLLALDGGARAAVGVQLDRCGSTVVVLDFAGRRLADARGPGTGDRAPGAVLDEVAAQVERTLLASGVDRGRVLGVGLVTHGPQDRPRGVVRVGRPTPDWRDFPLATTLARRLGLPVLLDHDAAAAALGEQAVADLGTATFGVLYMAEGIGGGLVVDGQVYRGGAANPGEIGHLPLDPAGAACPCGNRGCAEATAGPAAVVGQARADPALAVRLRLTGDPDATLEEFGRVGRAATTGDRAAEALLLASARRLGDAVVTMMNLVDVATVVLGGPAFAAAGELYAREVGRAAERGALARLLRPVSVRLSAAPTTAAATGAGLVVLRSPLGRAALPAPRALTPA